MDLTLNSLENWRHCPQVEKPGEFVDIVFEYLAPA